MKKEELRQQVLAKLRTYTGEAKLQSDRDLTAQLCALPVYQKASVVATYLSLPHEVRTGSLIEQARRDGKLVVVPKTFGAGKMIFVAYEESQLELTRFGVLEPRSALEVPKSQIDLIHVPGVVFSPDGYRIGYGGGYYDRYLNDYQGATVSTSYGFQLRELTPDSHDIAVQEVLVDERT